MYNLFFKICDLSTVFKSVISSIKLSETETAAKMTQLPHFFLFDSCLSRRHVCAWTQRDCSSVQLEMDRHCQWVRDVPWTEPVLRRSGLTISFFIIIYLSSFIYAQITVVYSIGGQDGEPDSKAPNKKHSQLPLNLYDIKNTLKFYIKFT